MQVSLAYLGRSGVRSDAAGQTLSLAPNLSREAVAFNAPLLKPLRFREAMSSLHDVVISDLRYKKKDKTSYREWKQKQQAREQQVHTETVRTLQEQVQAKHGISPDLENRYETARRQYWDARQAYSDHLRRHDMELWRMLMPCDPVVTVADDVVFFECFSADESSYGCLTVNRDDGFGPADSVKLGTTNVDYSWDLYNHFQALRSYRHTRFRVDPEGFEVRTKGHENFREEKIDLPQGWLKGFMQLQQSMGLPMTRVPISREAVYSILAFLKRHRSERSPRGVRFELLPGKSPRIVLEPWEQPIDSHGTIYDGPPVPAIRIWGRRRLMSLARVLPLADKFEVYLLGTGLPSFWVASMGEMRLTLGLSGWTANDWTRASAMELIAPPARATPPQVTLVGEFMKKARAAALANVARGCHLTDDIAAAALRHLAHSGQLAADLSAGLYRWRQIMPQVLGEAEMGGEHPELAAAKELMARRPVKIESREAGPGGSAILIGNIDNTPVEVVLDAERNIKRGKCCCGYYRKFSLRNGPCRHMIVLRRLSM